MNYDDFEFIPNYDSIPDDVNEEKIAFISKLMVASDYYDQGNIFEFLNVIDKAEINYENTL